MERRNCSSVEIVWPWASECLKAVARYGSAEHARRGGAGRRGRDGAGRARRYRGLLSREQERRRAAVPFGYRPCISLDRTRWTGAPKAPAPKAPAPKAPAPKAPAPKALRSKPLRCRRQGTKPGVTGAWGERGGEGRRLVAAGVIVVPKEFVPRGARLSANFYSAFGEPPNRSLCAAFPVRPRAPAPQHPR